ncbi:MAG: hypothetical protein LUH50_16955 [Bacteroides intestinalis]|nr:hypothetical protein [Bacteroides intestinalis]
MMLFIGIIVSSCLHDEEEVSVLEGSYKLPSTLTVGKVQMFTSEGVVTDEAKIKEFLAQKPKLDLPDNTAYFSFDASSVPIGDGNYLDITFTSNKAAVHTNLMLGKISIDTPYNADIFKISNLIVVSKNVLGLMPISTDWFISDFF